MKAKRDFCLIANSLIKSEINIYVRFFNKLIRITSICKRINGDHDEQMLQSAGEMF